MNTNYKTLKKWQKSVDLAVKVYKSTEQFPREEVYGLTSQVRRSAVSIPSNIAEGSGRNSDKEFNNFLGYSQGSSFELETQLIIANRIGLLKNATFQDLQENITEIQKMNYALKRRLTNS